MGDGGQDPTVDVRLEHRNAPGILPAGEIAWVTVDNARRLNCVGAALLDRFCGVMAEVAANPDVRAVVIAGAGGKAWVGGADLRELGVLDEDTGRAYIERVQGACQAIRDVPVPVIARIQGFCLGAGLEMAAACDMRIADETAVIGMPEVRLGVPSVVEAALLPQLIGWGKTRELVLLGGTYDAAAARDMGMFERLVPTAELDAAVEDWLAQIMAGEPKAMRAQKALVSRWEELALADGIRAGIDAFARSCREGEHQKLVAAFFEERARAKSGG